MENKLIKIFKKANYKPDVQMAERIRTAVVLYDKRVTRLKLRIFALIGLASLAGLIPATEMLFDNLSKSGIYDYFSLIFSDSGSILSYWKELMLSLAQSLPTMSIIFTLSLVFVFILSLRYMMRQMDKSQLLTLAVI